MTQSAQSLRQMRSIPHCSKAVFYVFVFYSDSATKHNLSPQIFHWTMFTHWWGEIGRLFLELNCGGQKQKTRERDCFRVLRCVQDSNQRPPAWQAGILTTWTNAPVAFSDAKIRQNQSILQIFRFFFAKKMHIALFWALLALSERKFCPYFMVLRSRRRGTVYWKRGGWLG